MEQKTTQPLFNRGKNDIPFDRTVQETSLPEAGKYAPYQEKFFFAKNGILPTVRPAYSNKPATGGDEISVSQRSGKTLLSLTTKTKGCNINKIPRDNDSHKLQPSGVYGIIRIFV